jgi:polyribonucleotide nucleotidyltransferase
MDVSVVSTENEMVMVEADANEISEEVILEAIKFGHQANLAIIELQKKLQKDHGKTKVVPAKKEMPSELSDRIQSILESKLDAILGHSDKTIRNQQLSALQDEVFNECAESYGENEIGYIFDTTLKKEIRTRILSRKEHIDGRKHDEIRDISCKVGLLPRTHGSALFARGATQVLTITTLGSTRQEQLLDGLSLEDSKHYMHHYNFPPFSTGEVKRTGSPGRREIGHGALAERSLLPVLPSEEDFRYTIRLVSEVLSSNGSTSMASTCGSSLALMDAGVPIKAPVAGIAMGLITGENGEHVVLTDIEGLEDFNGDMDFKVAGTRDGITALQLDIKLKGMNLDILAESMAQAQKARFEILDKMAQEIEASRPEISPYAPKIQEITIDTSKIGIVIGPGGKTIRAITDQTGASIDIKDDGKIIIASPNDESAQKALKMIDELTREVKVDDVFTGKVTRIFNFGAMVEILPGKEGLVHVSELSDHYVKNIEDEVKEGEEITVKVIEIDNMGRVNLSHKAIIQGSSYVHNSSNDKDRSSTGFRRNTQKRPGSRQGRSSNRYHNDDERNR